MTEYLSPRVARIAALPAPTIASADSGTTSATSRTCQPRARSCCSTGLEIGSDGVGVAGQTGKPRSELVQRSRLGGDCLGDWITGGWLGRAICGGGMRL